jgi:hypothetical protein
MVKLISFRASNAIQNIDDLLKSVNNLGLSTNQKAKYVLYKYNTINKKHTEISTCLLNSDDVKKYKKNRQFMMNPNITPIIILELDNDDLITYDGWDSDICYFRLAKSNYIYRYENKDYYPIKEFSISFHNYKDREIGFWKIYAIVKYNRDILKYYSYLMIEIVRRESNSKDDLKNDKGELNQILKWYMVQYKQGEKDKSRHYLFIARMKKNINLLHYKYCEILMNEVIDRESNSEQYSNKLTDILNLYNEEYIAIEEFKDDRTDTDGWGGISTIDSIDAVKKEDEYIHESFIKLMDEKMKKGVHGPIKHEQTQTKTEQPDAGQPDAGQPDAGQPKTEQPDAGQPDAGQKGGRKYRNKTKTIRRRRSKKFKKTHHNRKR